MKVGYVLSAGRVAAFIRQHDDRHWPMGCQCGALRFFQVFLALSPVLGDVLPPVPEGVSDVKR